MSNAATLAVCLLIFCVSFAAAASSDERIGNPPQIDTDTADASLNASLYDAKPLNLWRRVQIAGVAMADPERFQSFEIGHAASLEGFSREYGVGAEEGAHPDVLSFGVLREDGEYVAIDGRAAGCSRDALCDPAVIGDAISGLIARGNSGEAVVVLNERPLGVNIDTQELVLQPQR